MHDGVVKKNFDVSRLVHAQKHKTRIIRGMLVVRKKTTFRPQPYGIKIIIVTKKIHYFPLPSLPYLPQSTRNRFTNRSNDAHNIRCIYSMRVYRPTAGFLSFEGPSNPGNFSREKTNDGDLTAISPFFFKLL